MSVKETVDISKSIVIDAPIELVWHAWTIPSRVSQWFAPQCVVEPRIGGPFELYFNPADTRTMNTKGCTILKILQNEQLQFTWKGPDHLAAIMNNEQELTIVTVTFTKIDDTTEVTVLHSGWKTDAQWKDAIAWHEMAWTGVLSSLKSAIEKGEGELCCQP